MSRDVLFHKAIRWKLKHERKTLADKSHLQWHCKARASDGRAIESTTGSDVTVDCCSGETFETDNMLQKK